MTTGRINQITSLLGDPRPAGEPARRGGPTPPEGQSFVKRKGRTGRPTGATAPGVPGGPHAAIQLPPLSPSAPVRTQVTHRPPGGGVWALRHTVLGWRVQYPAGHAGEQRMPRGGSPQESGFRYGEPPTVHRRHRCRGPRGPRASGAAAVPHAGAQKRCCSRQSPPGMVQGQRPSAHQARGGDRSGREGVQPTPAGHRGS